ncbi:cutinase-domain-containing protein [Corynespora cassiicola Philippines]|uniref:Cutinase n=1 Tax=Corynespora cassiicola Philippines TaxID=1448308 RepID=A0A2T2PA73_CORCC|nr:cutinase-domain-containing protein [Corynespora cassiicola Philippines]
MKVSVSSILSVALLVTPSLAAPAPAAAGFPITELESVDLAPETSAITKRQYNGNTYNQLTDGTACRPITVIYARGTTQQGNVGDPQAVGPLFFNQLASRVGGTSQLAIQGVTYPANVAGFLQGGDPAGSTTMTNLISQAASRCPNTKIVLSGYSQGAQLVHNAAQRTSAANAARVAAVVVFGDPKRGQSFGSIASSKILTICHDGDNICEGGIIITPAHTNYQQDAPAAAQFVAARV